MTPQREGDSAGPTNPGALSTLAAVKLAYTAIDGAGWVAMGIVFVAMIGAFNAPWALVGSYWLRVPAMLIVIVGIGFLYRLVWSIHARLIARIRVRHQLVLKGNVRRDHRAPFLFLRSFTRGGLRSGTQRLWVIGAGDTMGPREGPRYIPIDRIADLLKAVSAVGPFVALSTAKDTSITRDDVCRLDVTTDWEGRVSALCSTMRAIILLPDSSDGVVAEMKALASSDALARVLVYMPPWIPDQDPPDGIEHHWNKVRDELATHGWELPAFLSSGCLYIPDERFSAAKLVRFAGSRPSHFRDALDEALNGLPQPAGTRLEFLSLLD